ncbi:MAG: IS110 family transposase [Pirellulaceae bacterium]|nr:IS110 family transposase [Pirellulaceae bacterium]
MSDTIVPYQSFIGVDLHKNTVTLAAVRPDGSLIDRVKIPTKCRNRIEEWLLAQPRPSHLAVEAVGFVEWFIDDYRPCVDRIDIADATELANRRGKRRKNDPNDARDIAQRLARGECPLGYIADDELMQLRKLGRHWHQLSRLLTRTKHSMRSMLLAANIAGPKLDGPAAQKWLLAFGHLLKPVQRQAFSNFLDIVQLVERQRAQLHRQITFANRAERFRKTVELLKSVPGIDEIWACVIAAEIGPFDRFPNADALEFWAGLTSDLQESAGRTQSGKITKAGSRTLRWALCKAALTLCRSDKKPEAVRQRLIRRIGKPKANVAMGRRLLRILYAMIRDGKTYARGPATKHNLAANSARMARKKREETA